MSLTKLFAGIIFVMLPLGVSAQATDTVGRKIWTKEYSPPAIYEQWWREIAACEHLPLPPQHRDVRWYLVPVRPFRLADDSFHIDSDAEAASDAHGGRETYVNYTGVVDELLIKHEQLHHLLFWKNGNRVPAPDDHPDPYYKTCDMVRVGQEKR